MANKNDDKRGIYHNNEANNEGVIIDERSGAAVHESMLSDFSSQIAAAEAADGDPTKAGFVEAAPVSDEPTTSKKKS